MPLPVLEEQQTLLHSLAQAVDCIEPRFCAYGTTPVADGKATIKLLSTNQEFSFPLPSQPDRAAPLDARRAADEVAPLLAAAQAVSQAARPSTAMAALQGHRCFELPADKFTTSFDPVEAGILEEVRMALVPEAGDIRAELLKMTLMEPRATIAHRTAKDHLPKDSSTCFGLLEVVMPLPYVGRSVWWQHGSEFVCTTRSDSPMSNTSGTWPEWRVFRHLAAATEGAARDNGTTPAQPNVVASKPAALEPSGSAAGRLPDAPTLFTAGGSGIADELGLHEGGQASAATVKPNKAGVERLRHVLWSAAFGDVSGSVGVKPAHLSKGPFDWDRHLMDQHREVDCPHIALVYALHRDDQVGDSFQSLLKRATQLSQALHKAVSSPVFMPEGGKLGVHFRNTYKENMVSKAEKQLAAGRTVKDEASALKLGLKEADAIIVAVLANSGLPLEVVRMVKREANIFRTSDNEGEKASLELFVLDKLPTKKEGDSIGWRGIFSRTCHKDQLERMAQGSLKELHGEVAWLGSRGPNLWDWVKVNPIGHTSEYYAETWGTSSGLLLVIPAASERSSGSRAPKLQLQQVVPFKMAKKKAGKQPPKKKVKSGKGKQRQEYDSEDSWLEEDDIELTDEADEREEGKENRQQGCGRKRGPHEQQQGNISVSLMAPPNLFAPSDPELMTAAQKKTVEQRVVRHINVFGGQGKNVESACSKELREGRGVVVLGPGDGLASLKSKIKKHFGKVKLQKVGPLLLADADGNAGSCNVTTADLKDGLNVRATYVSASGGFGMRLGGWMPHDLMGSWDDL